MDRQATDADGAMRAPWVVGLVASIGGLDAISQVLVTLPASYPGAIVVLQHTTPTHPSQLAEILSRRTALKVTLAQDGDRLQPGLVLVAPAGRHILVCPDQTVALINSGQMPPWRPSADLLLTSMALSCGARAVAVILSGAGHDGTAGAAAVKRLGGAGHRPGPGDLHRIRDARQCDRLRQDRGSCGRHRRHLGSGQRPLAASALLPPAAKPAI